MSTKRAQSSPESINENQAAKKQNITTIMGEVVAAIHNFFTSPEAEILLEKVITKVVSPILQRCEILKQENAEMKLNIRKLEENVTFLGEQLEILENKQEEFDQGQRRNNLVVSNHWEEKAGEIPFLMFKRYCAQVLKYNLDEKDILQCYRVGNTAKTVNRPIMVKLRTADIKREILDARRVMSKHLRQVEPDDDVNNAPQNEGNLGSQSYRQVYLNEDLTHQRRTIFTEMRSLKKTEEDTYQTVGYIMET